MRVLIVVDVQLDFLPGGPLGVPGGDEVVPVLSELAGAADAVVATRDWHPASHVSFAETHPGRSPGERIVHEGLEQVLWPVHCVQDTPGAEFADGLILPPDTVVVDKGVDPGVDSYSAFFDNAARRGTGLAEILEAMGALGAAHRRPGHRLLRAGDGAGRPAAGSPGAGRGRGLPGGRTEPRRRGGGLRADAVRRGPARGGLKGWTAGGRMHDIGPSGPVRPPTAPGPAPVARM